MINPIENIRPIMKTISKRKINKVSKVEPIVILENKIDLKA